MECLKMGSELLITEREGGLCSVFFCLGVITQYGTQLRSYMCMSVHCQNSNEETNWLRRIRRILSDGHARLRLLGALPGPDQLLPTPTVSKVAVAVANKAGDNKSKAAKSKSETKAAKRTYVQNWGVEAESQNTRFICK